MLRQRLSQKLLQKLSPQQIQLMKLLQVPTASLEERIQEELEVNPALEEGGLDDSADDYQDTDESGESENDSLGEDLNLDDYFSEDDDYDSYRTRSERDPNEEERTVPVAVTESFQERLASQLGMVELDSRTFAIAEQLIGSLDEDGYLRRELDAIADDLAFSRNITVEAGELEHALLIVQGLEPAGIGARDLRECLLLQLHRKPENPIIRLAIRVLEEQFDEFSKKHYERMQRMLKVEEDEIKLALGEILKLNPKPGGTGGESKQNQYIIPDFTILNNSGVLELLLNSRNAPELRVSHSFKDIYQAYKASPKKDKRTRDEILYIKQKMDSAKWFIDAIRQRQQTLYNTMASIVELQEEFFLTGDETNLRPMILKDVAELTGLDISTISRVANSKYVATEFGTFPLKYFFSESLTTDSGEEVSTREVKRILSDMIGAENKRRPLSDQKLTEILQEKGYNIARRTVAKYREQLNIPVARLRKEL
ncbi:MAG: RNA polymerase factor sigma-54 [Bacteroidetes bacterium]|nr:RNA polymerase factor sigma-54 [Bacteroidota bacterium]